MCLAFGIYPGLLHDRQEQPIYVKINEYGSLINPMNCSINVKGYGGSGEALVKIWNWKKAAVAVRRGHRGRDKLFERNSSIQNITTLANALGFMDVILLKSLSPTCFGHSCGHLQGAENMTGQNMLVITTQ